MGGLSHFIEAEGIATTQISLIREHSEKINPPRALWVPFDLGRPLGIPNDPVFQTSVMQHVLSLLELSDGPVLEDFADEAEESCLPAANLACPVDFSSRSEAKTPIEKLLLSFTSEIDSMRTWHDIASKNRQRTTIGVSGLALEDIVDLFSEFLNGTATPGSDKNSKLSDRLRMAIEDIKAYYLEALTAQPGQATDISTLSDWFWGQTYAALVINEVRKSCLKYESGDMALAGKLLLIPRNQMHRFNG